MHRRYPPTLLRFALASALLLVVALTGSAAAWASSATVMVTTSDGLSDPAAGVPRVFTVSGRADAPGRIYVAFRSPGGAGCAPSASSDSGHSVGSFYGSPVDGTFSFSEARTWAAPGPVVFCIWIARSDSAVAVPFTQTMTFRPPVGAIAAVVQPITPQLKQPVTITVYGQSETPAKAFVKIRGSGDACAASYDADVGKAVLSGVSVNGAFTLQGSTTQASAGAYRVCLWLAEWSGDLSPIARQEQWLYVLAPPRPVGPPPPCLVPGVTHGIRLATMKRRIIANNCAVGKVRYLASRTVAARVIIRLSSRAGAKLQANSPVTIYVSTGRRGGVTRTGRAS